MPTYEFICKTCDQTISVTAPMGEAQRPKCLACQTDMIRDYGIGAITFKGSGFYRTDQ